MESNTEKQQHSINEKPSERINGKPQTPDSWAVYTGNVGLYGKHIVLEIMVFGDSVKGSYFYTKHQKPITLTGTINEKNHIKAKESYKGKTTGYWEFTISKGDILGKWSKYPSMKEPEGLIAKLSSIDQSNYHPDYSRYQWEHSVPFYNGESEDFEEVTDVCTINWLDEKHFTFHYNVTRRNGHLGSVEGMAIINDKGVGIFNGEYDCELTFEFEKDNLNISESNCSYYHGANAYFDGTLVKVKK